MYHMVIKWKNGQYTDSILFYKVDSHGFCPVTYQIMSKATVFEIMICLPYKLVVVCIAYIGRCTKKNGCPYCLQRGTFII